MVSISTNGGGTDPPPLPDPTATGHPVNPPPIYLVEIIGGDEPRYPVVTLRRGDAHKVANHFNGLVNTDGARAVVHRCEIPPLVEIGATASSHQSQLPPPVEELDQLANLFAQLNPADASATTEAQELLGPIAANPLGAIAHALGKEGAVLAQGLREMASAIEAFAASQE